MEMSNKNMIYNPHEKKLNSGNISEFLIGYSEKPKGYEFYYTSTRIIETEKYQVHRGF